jgi:Na+-transporting NADH:ubiquinone oxidoreductase subunit C
MSKRLWIVVFTVMVTVVFITPISLLHLLTKPIVDLNEEVFLKRSVLYAAGLPVPARAPEIVALFNERVQERPGAAGNPAYYQINGPGGQPVGYVFIRTGPGLWGEITATVGFDRSLEKLTGVDFLRQSETPGLGARIAEPWFREQFRGKKGPLTVVAEGEPAGENEFDAITGATLTTSFVKDLLNNTVGQVKGLID